MANGTTIPAPGTTPSTGGLNLADYQKKVQLAAAKTRDVRGTQLPGFVTKSLKKVPKTSPEYMQGSAAIKQFQTEATAKKAQAEKAATALEMTGEATTNYLSNLEGIQKSIKQTVGSASQSFASAAEKADEYVKAARGRVSEVLTKLDEINTKIGKERDFAQAHSMQVAVQATMGSMKTEERNILENYGAASKEYQQFTESKKTALATVNSNIMANYATLREQQGQTYLGAVSDAYTKSNMYVGFQEQQHVEMLKFMDEQKNAYALQGAQLEVNIEQLKMAGMENLANWIIETPTFTMDMTPMVSLLADILPRSQPALYGQESTIASGGIRSTTPTLRG